MTTWQQNRIGTALNGTNPMVMAEMPGGFAVFGDTQFLPGYSVLLPKRVVGSLNDLLVPERARFLKDMSILGDAVLQATGALRINYDILGNRDQFLHAHVFPRYQSESKERLEKPVWLYTEDYWFDAQINMIRRNKADYVRKLQHSYGIILEETMIIKMKFNHPLNVPELLQLYRTADFAQEKVTDDFQAAANDVRAHATNNKPVRSRSADWVSLMLNRLRV